MSQTTAAKAIAFDVTTLVKALSEADKFIAQILLEEQGLVLTESLSWKPGTNVPREAFFQQLEFCRRFQAVQRELSSFGELQAWARWKAEELNQILSEHGFSIRLEPWEEDRRTFGVVAIYDLSVKWLVKGDILDPYGRPYLVNGLPDCPAFRLARSSAGVEFFQVTSDPIIRIPGQNPGDYVCITKHHPISGFELLEEVERIAGYMSYKYQVDDWDGVILPNILFDTNVDVSWLVGLQAIDPTETPWTIAQALMQAKFALGPEGARAKVAAAIAVMRSISIRIPKPDYYVDDDIIIWFARESVKSGPLFSAFVPKTDFAKKVVSLSELGPNDGGLIIIRDGERIFPKKAV